jgi:sarcosine oxidase subunit delta
MLLIDCPWCGERDHDEFTYLGDASVERPGDGASEQDWMEYVYLRDNPRGDHWEYWHHSSGCQTWIKVHRHTVTHEIHETVAANDRFLEYVK